MINAAVGVAQRPIPIRNRTIFIALLVLVMATLAACWAATKYDGVDKDVTSNIFIAVGTTAYLIVLLMPWLNLQEQENFNQAQRLDQMGTYWLAECAIAHSAWELPWVLFHQHIMGKMGEGQLWSYFWWTYADGGDTRYFAPDGNLLALESGASVMGIIEAVLFFSRIKAGRFSNRLLVAVIVAMVCEFYSTILYVLSEAYEGMRHVHGVANFIVKFGYGNILWLAVPPIVFLWSRNLLISRGDPTAS